MKTKTLLVAALSSTFLLAACGGAEENTETTENTETPKEDVAEAEAEAEEVTYTIDTESSTVHWKGTMMGMYSHEGNVKIKEGTITVKDGKVTGGNVVVDMTTITPTDDGYNPEEGKTKEKLVGHLSSDDFFLVEEHPTASYKVTGSEGGKVMGELTVRGNTNEAHVTDLQVTNEGDKMMANGNLTFDRQKYGVAFSHPAQEMVLSDDIELTLNIIATK